MTATLLTPVIHSESEEFMLNLHFGIVEGVCSQFMRADFVGETFKSIGLLGAHLVITYLNF